MEYIYGTRDVNQSENSVVVLGNFDGVHRGHQKLLQVAMQQGEAKNLKTIVFLFILIQVGLLEITQNH